MNSKQISIFNCWHIKDQILETNIHSVLLHIFNKKYRYNYSAYYLENKDKTKRDQNPNYINILRLLRWQTL